jgi:hypothetical protein
VSNALDDIFFRLRSLPIFVMLKALHRGELPLKDTARAFTLEEANALIPVLEDLLGEYARRKERCERLHDFYFMNELLYHREGAVSDGRLPVLEAEARDLDDHAVRMREIAGKILELGCRVRDLESGRIEFPAAGEKDRIYLCWSRGEKKVSRFRKSGAAEESVK